jgi:arabinose-5-phosphate isomerase
MTLALGDALAMVLMDRRGFTAEDFGLHHPGGKLGMSLQRVRDWMGDRPPAPATVPLTASFAEVVSAITEGRKGATVVTNDDGTLAGIVTDGDVRRAFARDLNGLTAADVMSPKPKTISPDARMSDAIDLMTQNRIATLLVVEADRPLAIVHIAELMQAGYVG